MKKFVRRAFTRVITVERGKGKKTRIEIPPSDRFVLLMEFAIATLVALVILEIGHLLILSAWNDEVFLAISNLITAIVSLFVGKKT